MKKGYLDLPSKNINQISGKFTTAYQVEKHIDELRDQINELKAFKTQAIVILAVAATLLLPLFKESITKAFQWLSPETSLSSEPKTGTSAFTATPPPSVAPTSNPNARPSPQVSPTDGPSPSNQRVK
ncbi:MULTISPECIES: hypothetical protein [Bradyrhizobium]|uniref:hypothetical protein n=1 Tax=Bradyrhizobium elkanii TaxID=29448 RepID=UPI00271480AB|nr:hypothetical protein [Bradyrhizobium elkanii]WLA48290.1 hypothetical protein QIH80_43160 [Bradyrhizobium elkanii]WLB81506.1 hypothetical protein QIH83_02300 [Bradyrhizobium elkanii]